MDGIEGDQLGGVARYRERGQAEPVPGDEHREGAGIDQVAPQQHGAAAPAFGQEPIDPRLIGLRLIADRDRMLLRHGGWASSASVWPLACRLLLLPFFFGSDFLSHLQET